MDRELISTAEVDSSAVGAHQLQSSGERGRVDRLAAVADTMIAEAARAAGSALPQVESAAGTRNAMLTAVVGW